MSQDEIGHLDDWTDQPFPLIAKHLLSNGKRSRRTINNIEGEISISVEGDNWILKHNGFRGGSITVSSTYSDQMAPKDVIP